MRWSHFLKQFGLNFLTDAAGKWTIDFSIPIRFVKNKLYEYNTIDTFIMSIHIMPHTNHKMWGYQLDWYDHHLHSFGLGPLVLFCWTLYPVLEKD